MITVVDYVKHVSNRNNAHMVSKNSNFVAGEIMSFKVTTIYTFFIIFLVLFEGFC